MTPARRLALIAVADGAVRIDEQGCRDYPAGVNGTALTAAFQDGLWFWPGYPTVAGDVAQLTDAGREALARDGADLEASA